MQLFVSSVGVLREIASLLTTPAPCNVTRDNPGLRGLIYISESSVTNIRLEKVQFITVIQIIVHLRSNPVVYEFLFIVNKEFQTVVLWDYWLEFYFTLCLGPKSLLLSTIIQRRLHAKSGLVFELCCDCDIFHIAQIVYVTGSTLYMRGSRNFWKGGGVQPLTTTFVHHLVWKGGGGGFAALKMAKNDLFWVKFSNQRVGGCNPRNPPLDPSMD